MTSLTLDDLDLRILNVLQADASISNLELSRRVHASAPTCLRRVRALSDAGVIARRIAIIDLASWRLTHSFATGDAPDTAVLL
jgi:DNA-binding Lrp family transcriptional regulator